MKYLKNKKIVFTIITIVLFMVFFVGNFYVRKAYASRVYFMNAYVPMEQLVSGDVLEQEFLLQEGDEGVNVPLGTYVTTLGGGSVKAELYDSDGQIIGETEAELKGIMDNYPVSLWFGEFDESLYGQKLKIKMTFLDIDNELVTVFGSATDIDKYQGSLNGKPLGWNIAMDGIKSTFFVEYSDFRNFFVCGFGIFAAYLALFKVRWKEIDPKKTVIHYVTVIKANWKKILLTIGLMAGCGVFGAIVEGGLSANSAYANPYRAYTFSVAAFIIVFTIVFYKYLWQRVHVFFVALVMLMGSVYIISQPPTPLSYDEQLHYGNTAYISWGATDRMSVSDYYMYSMYTQKTYFNIFQKAEREAWIEEINVLDGQNQFIGFLAPTGITQTPYFITSIMLYVFRIFQLNFVTRYFLGKFVNLFIYAFCFGLSIKLLQGRGKLLTSMIGLIPMHMLLASSYGYDWWVIAFVALGFAVFISELQKQDKISTKKFALSTGLICLGMLPKAVYFPLLFPMMLLKKERYEDSKKCRAITVAGAVFLVLSFVLPLIISVDAGAVGGGGDIRGGSDVNAAGQIAYILSNFGEYLKMLFNFLKEYLHPDDSFEILTSTAYQGVGPYYSVCLIVLMLATFLDNSKKTVFKNREPLTVLGNYIGCFGGVVLVVTALYVAYTAVGADTVNGCQARYLLPIVFPFLYFFGENQIDVSDKMKAKIYAWGSVLMALVYLIMIYDAFVIKY